MKTNNPPVFLLDFSYLREFNKSKILVKNAFENDLKFKYGYELDFSMIFVDFGGILGCKIGPKWKKH